MSTITSRDDGLCWAYMIPETTRAATQTQERLRLEHVQAVPRRQRREIARMRRLDATLRRPFFRFGLRRTQCTPLFTS